MRHYAKSVSAMSKFFKNGKTLEEFESMGDQELNDWIYNFIDDEIKEQDKIREELGENVLIFPSIDKDKLH